jgi:putative transposase
MQVKDGGITKFMRKLGTGYTMYFNEKNKRTGVLFQGKFKAILIDNDEYLAHLSRYIHINPLEISNSNLNNYRWSSYLDYIGIKNFPSVINKKIIGGLFPKGTDYRDFVSQFVSGDLEKINHLILE